MVYELYHGRSVTDSTFSYDYVGLSDSIDQYGPGFYFSDDIELAEQYASSGGLLIKANVTINNPLSFTKDIKQNEVSFMLRNTSHYKDMIKNKSNPEKLEEIFYNSVFSDFGETIKDAFNEAVDAYLGLSQVDALHTLWRDFYKYDSRIKS